VPVSCIRHVRIQTEARPAIRLDLARAAPDIGAMNAEARTEAAEPRPVHLKDYRPPDWLIEAVELDFGQGRRALAIHTEAAISMQFPVK
jgi:hypothetical protein